MDEQREGEFKGASEALVRAVQAHTAAILAAGDDVEAVDDADSELGAALTAYAQAQDGAAGDAEDPDDEPSLAGATISVLRRTDYLVGDPEAVLAAGRAAYLEVWPDDDEAAAAEDVDGLGRALHQVAHAGGWDRLLGLDGLVPVGAITAVVGQPEPLDDDPDAWFDQLGVDEDDLLHAQSDVWSD